jgi:uncharacterized protein YifE (UPF0438 family)
MDREFFVPGEFPATPEERAILRRWGHVFEALDAGERRPETKRQELFVEEVHGVIYAASISAVLWMRFVSWSKAREEAQQRSRQEEADRFERGLQQTKAKFEAEAAERIKRQESDSWYTKWLSAHEFDDFR